MFVFQKKFLRFKVFWQPGAYILLELPPCFIYVAQQLILADCAHGKVFFGISELHINLHYHLGPPGGKLNPNCGDRRWSFM